MDQISDLKTGYMDGSLEQQAMRLIDNGVDQAVHLIVQHFPTSDGKANEAKLRIKSASNREIHRLTSEGRQM